MAFSLKQFFEPGAHRFRLPMGVTAASILFTIAAPTGTFTRMVSVFLLMGSVLLSLHATEMTRGIRRAFGAMIIFASALSATGTAIDHADWVRGVGELIAIVPILFAAVMVVRWITRQKVITFEAVVAGILVYLLVAMAFADLYGAIADLATHELFCTQGDGTVSERVYFSLVTITTTGYGDFTSCMQVGRAVAVSEAVFGQIYLVTIISLLVGNMGRSREAVARPKGAPKSIEAESGD